MTARTARILGSILLAITVVVVAAMSLAPAMRLEKASAIPVAAKAPAPGPTKTKLVANWGRDLGFIGDTLTVTGTVTPFKKADGTPRLVQLQRFTAKNTWQSVGKTQAVGGKYKIQFVLDRAGYSRFRVRVPVVRNATEATSAVHVVEVGKQPTTVTLQLPAAKAKRGDTVTFTGQVLTRNKGIQRTVRLYRMLADAPQLLKETETTADGAYQMTMPTGFNIRTNVFVTVPYTETADSAVSDQTPFEVTPAYTTLPKADSWSRAKTDAGLKYRFNPCAPVTWRYNNNGSKIGAGLADAQKAFNRLTQATGITFQYLGTTTFLPGNKTDRPWPTDTNVVIAWGNPDAVKWDLKNNTASATRVFSSPKTGAEGAVNQVNRAGVVLNKVLPIKPGWGKGAYLGQIYLHELGLIAGLGNSSDNNQMMNSSIEADKDAQYNAGDVNGLLAVGLQAGCLS